MTDGPRRLQIPASLTKPILVGGAERTPTAVVCGIGAAFVVIGWTQPNWAGLAFGFVSLSVGMWVLREVAKEDPIMFQVYRRYLKYRKFYPARCPPQRERQWKRLHILTGVALAAGLLLLWHWTGVSLLLGLSAGLVVSLLVYGTYPEPA